MPNAPAPLPFGQRGPGLRARFSEIKGETGRGLLPYPLYLPVVIGEYVDDEEFSHRDYSTVGKGDFSTPMSSDPAARLLREQSFDTLTIDWHRYAKWLTNHDTSPEDCRRILRKLGLSKTPFELLVSAKLGVGRDEVRMNVTMRRLRREIRPGEADTRYMSIELKEWRDNDVERRGSAGSSASSGSTNAGKKKLPTTKKVTQNTTLRSASREFYGSDVPEAIGWVLIAQANGLDRYGGSDVIMLAKGWGEGSTLKIPKPEKYLTTLGKGSG